MQCGYNCIGLHECPQTVPLLDQALGRGNPALGVIKMKLSPAVLSLKDDISHIYQSRSIEIPGV